MKATLAAVSVMLFAITACTRTVPRPPAADWTLHLDPLASPAGDASAQPQLTASSEEVLLSWLENAGSQTTFKFSERTATGWSDARPIAARDDFFANWADVPSVVRLADRTLVAHWLQQGGRQASAYDLRLTRSSDDGRTWSPPFSPHHDGTKSEHGFASLFEVRGTGLGLVWLDGRAMTPSADPDGEGTGDMSLRAATYDRDWTEPSPVHNDGWRIDGCPINGPALSASGRDVAVAWFTVQQDQGRAFVALSRDAGRAWGAAIRVDDAESLGRVDVEQMPDGSAVVGWMELAGRRALFKVRRVDRSGTRSAAVAVADLADHRNSGYPRMARRGDELLIAWTGSGDSLQIQTAVGRVP